MPDGSPERLVLLCDATERRLFSGIFFWEMLEKEGDQTCFSFCSLTYSHQYKFDSKMDGKKMHKYHRRVSDNLAWNEKNKKHTLIATVMSDSAIVDKNADKVC